MSSSTAMGSWMGTPSSAVSTVMFRPRLLGIEMKLAGCDRGAVAGVQSRGVALSRLVRASQRLEDQAHVERRRGVGQRSHAYEVDARLRDRAHRFERHPARGLEL